jgi:hypothetical protein
MDGTIGRRSPSPRNLSSNSDRRVAVSSDRVSVERRIAAPAARIFAVVSSPAGHVEIDGSGMLVAPFDPRPVTAVGETFDMNMDREPLGDYPEMGKYQVRNTVTQLVTDRLVEWTVGPREGPPYGHVYGWRLEPVGETETDVVHYCDWSGVEGKYRTMRPWPIVPVEMLERSVDNLERLVISD